VLKCKTKHGFAGVGDEIVCVVQRARPISATALASTTAVKVRAGDVRRAVVVRTKKTTMRPDGRFIRFDDNAAVLINNKREMLGTRIGGVVSADLRFRGWSKIVALAPKVRGHTHTLSFPSTSTLTSIYLVGCLDYFTFPPLMYSVHPSYSYSNHFAWVESNPFSLENTGMKHQVDLSIDRLMMCGTLLLFIRIPSC